MSNGNGSENVQSSNSSHIAPINIAHNLNNINLHSHLSKGLQTQAPSIKEDGPLSQPNLQEESKYLFVFNENSLEQQEDKKIEKGDKNQSQNQDQEQLKQENDDKKDVEEKGKDGNNQNAKEDEKKSQNQSHEMTFIDSESINNLGSRIDSLISNINSLTKEIKDSNKNQSSVLNEIKASNKNQADLLNEIKESNKNQADLIKLLTKKFFPEEKTE